MTSQDSAPAPDDGPTPDPRPDDGGVPLDARPDDDGPTRDARPDGGGVQPAPEAAPDEVLPRVADAALVRRAPRFGAFIRAGVLLGAALGVLAAFLVRAGSGSPSFAVVALTALGLASLGALVAASLAVLADRRSQRRADRGDGPRATGPRTDGPPS